MPGVSVGLLYEALGSATGIVLRTNDAGRLRQKLYALRVQAKDPDLDVLSIVQSPTAPNELWIGRFKDKTDAT